MWVGVVLLALALASGYLYSVNAEPSKSLSPRETGYRLYFRAAIYGFFMLLAAALIYLWLLAQVSEQGIGTDAAGLLARIVELFGEPLLPQPNQPEKVPAILVGTFLLVLPTAASLAALNVIVIFLLNIITFKRLRLWLARLVLKNRHLDLLVLETLGKKLGCVNSFSHFSGWG
jgi:hypothetical protein